MTAFAAIDNEERRAEGLRWLFLIFLAGCVVGWIYEEVFYWFTEGLLRNRGILYGPWLPIYGIGALGKGESFRGRRLETVSLRSSAASPAAAPSQKSGI